MMPKFVELKGIIMNFDVHTGNLRPYNDIIDWQTLHDMEIVLDLKII